MNKCLVTTLQGSVSNDSMLKYGHLRLRVEKQSEYDASHIGSHSFFLNVNNPCVVTVIGDGKIGTSNDNITLSTILVEANKETRIYVSNNTFEIDIEDRNAVKTLIIDNDGSKPSSIVIGDVDNLKYCKNLNKIIMKGLWNALVGNVEDLYNRDFTYFQFINCDISGDITDFHSQRAILSGTKVYGDFTNLLKAGTTNEKLFGLGNIKYLYRDGICKADFSQASSSYSSMTLEIGNNVISTWKTVRDSASPIISFIRGDKGGFFEFGTDLSAMIINQANCQPSSAVKVIRANGVIPASDSSDYTLFNNAISTLKQKGYTVEINNVIL